jgi:hypothetical protein
MKNLLFLLLLCALPAFGQGTRVDVKTQYSVGDVVNVIPNAPVSVCTSAATGIPCSPTTTVYSDVALTSPITQPFSSDAQGNIGFYVRTGEIYQYTINPNPSVPLGAGPFTITPACNPAGTCTFANAGIFTSTQMNEYLQAILNSCSVLTEFQAVQGGKNFSTDAVSGCVPVPVGATVHQANGIAGYANTSSTTTATVGLYGQGRCLANTTLCWGSNQVIADLAGESGAQMLGDEIDINAAGTPSTLEGLRVVGDSTGTVPATAIAAHFGIIGPGKKWPNGLVFDDSSVAGAAFVAGSTTASANSNSQLLIFHTRDSGNVVRSVKIVANTGFAADRMLAMNDPGANAQFAFDFTAMSSAFATATTAGTCVQNTTAVRGATTGMAVAVSPVSTPGVGAVWSAFVSSAGNVTINECAVATSAGGSIAFNIRVIP